MTSRAATRSWRRAAFFAILALVALAGCAQPAARDEGAAGDPELEMVDVHVGHAFEPMLLRRGPGDLVVWENVGAETHVIVDESGRINETIAPGAKAAWRADAPGDYALRCAVHGFRGAIEITAA